MPNPQAEPNIVRVEPDVVGLARAYLDKRIRELAVIERAVACGDYAALHRIGHNLAGSGRMFGFDELTVIGGELQQAADACDAAGVRCLRARIAEFVSRTRVEEASCSEAAMTSGIEVRSAPILVIDDDEMNRILIAHHLEREGYAVVQCSSGEAALSLLSRGALPALILLDVVMGAMSGLDVCRRIKADPATGGIPVILLTALEGEEDRLRGMQAGADDFLVKPVNRPALLDRVLQLLPLRSAAHD